MTSPESFERIASRELDAEIGERVMGLRVFPEPTWGDPWRVEGLPDTQLPPFSTDIAAAWTVVEKLKSFAKIGDVPCDLCIKVGIGDGVFCEIFDMSPMGYVGYEGDLISSHAEADTAPLAICLAALGAVAR